MKALFSLTLIIALSAPFAQAAIQGKSGAGWIYTDIDPNGKAGAIFPNTQGGFVQGSLSSQGTFEQGPIKTLVRMFVVKSIKESQLGLSEQAWKAQLASARDLSKLVKIQERVVKQGNAPARFYAEYEENTGAERSLHIAVMATVVDGQLVVLLYEQQRDTYKSDIRAVLDLFTNVQFSAN